MIGNSTMQRGESESYTDKPILPVSHQSSPSRKNRIASWWASQSRLRKIVYILLPILLLLGLILGLALGLTLGKKATEDSNPSADYVPTTISGSRSSLLQQGYWYTAPSNGTNFNWTSSGNLGNYRSDSQGVDIVIDTSQRFQTIDGFGGAMTDSSAYLLDRLRTRESSLYTRVMDFLFNNATGVGITRVSMGASDFSVSQEYSYIPNPPDFNAAASQLDSPDSLLSSFSTAGTQSAQYTIPVLVDALERNPDLKVVLSPWSPPAFMKSNNTMNGGQLRNGFIPLLAQYYAQTAQAWADAGVRPFAMTLQNEPSHIAAYPSMGMTASQQVQLAEALKGQLASRGLSGVQIWGHDDNYAGWQVASDIVNGNATAVDAIAFHCYRGSPSQIAQYQSALQNGVSKPIHMSECTGTSPSSRWSGIQGWLNNVYWPMAAQNASSVIQWNLALDGGYGPHLKTSYCSTCSGSLTLSSQWNPTDPYVDYNDQVYLTAHFAGASTDLTNVGGGPAVRVGAQQGTQFSLDRSDFQCLNWVAYAAPLSGSTLQSASTTNGGQPTRRVGFVIANTCSDTKTTVVSVDGRRTTVPVRQGLTSFVWTAP
ncbi:Glycoside hydrolase, family 30 [Kalmanozyma brasiliensis GHG001]|uniref:Glycosyl hydrolase family 30 TIM-barrel domain-containing protein n=1 Tax=Kalmanozyma brasiliensis (strain GHG001) TaxID=1365824 RepID=V5EFM9_KALBG|nr:Glycoside hydrolase, family 30 [Kalmanozyma brasiliensis GHG001]EST09316.1 Glycoside hydrolase, family 30 [Kalmanozyma brasiliensis GHG001]